MTTDETTAAVETHGGQENQTPQRYRMEDIPSIRELHPGTVRAIADAALRLFVALEAETSAASYGLDYRLRLFRERIVSELFLQPKFAPQPPADQGGPGAVKVSAAESAASTVAEAQKRVTAKRVARLAADAWRGEMDEPAEAFGGEPA